MQNPSDQFSRPEVPWDSKDYKANYPDILIPLLKHNRPIPSQLTKRCILEIQGDAERSLLNLEAEISSVDVQILALQQKRQELVQQATPGWMTLDACKKVLAPIRNVPLEIFQEIVLHALPPQPYPTLNHAPMSLSHVCKDWRNALLAFPQAWQELFLEVDIAWIRYPQTAVETWFERAKHLPLSFYIHFDHEAARHLLHEHSVKHFNRVVLKFLQQISSFFPQIRHFGLSADQVLLYFPFFRFLAHNIHSLTLHMNKSISSAEYCSHFSTAIDETYGMFAFQKRLNLKKLSLDDPMTFRGAGRLMFPWSQLTDLDLRRHISRANWTRLLTLCPQLRKGSFHLSDEDDKSDELSTHDSDDEEKEEELQTIHHHLEELRVHVHDEAIRFSWCFEACQFPGLRLLRLSHHEFVDVGRDGEVGQDFTPEFTFLQGLSVEGDWSESPEPLQQLFIAAASVTKLAVMIDLDTQSVLKMLTYGYHTSADGQRSDEDSNTSVKEPQLIMPNLSSLTLVVGTISDDELPEILKWMEPMLTSRTTANQFNLPHHLQIFRLLSESSVDDNVFRRIQSLLDCYSGFDFRVGGLRNLHREDPTTCAKWKAGIKHRMSRREVARANQRMGWAMYDINNDPDQSLFDFPGY
ncbi:unnamed protein product [Cyclocybe aegerita]|uniref:F-box domain-containing protein n=1 Tax=Cyclocybe aegerita TaxID=1973307 RepID=A0A8S0VY88_CYCAE|nr:unnamed protein product [Cyclocybe aegerita]